MRTRHSCGILDATYPVARILSITSRIFRRFALWVGSDRPTPRGAGEGLDSSPIVDDMSGVVAKEQMDDAEDLAFLRGVGVI